MHDNVHVFNVDAVRNREATKCIQDEILELSEDTDAIIYLFSSPQKLNDKSGWGSTVNKLISTNKLRLLAVDECHLFANFGMEFQLEFYKLRDSLFSKLSFSDWNIPLLFMTATPSKGMIEDLELLTGLKFDPSTELFWSNDPTTVQRRNIDISFQFNNSPLPALKEVLALAISNNKKEKAILYTNSLSSAKR